MRIKASHILAYTIANGWILDQIERTHQIKNDSLLL